MLTVILFCVGAYVLGSIPTGVLVGRALGVDVRAVGSGNIGATNVGRALGRKWAALVLVADALKGFLPTFIGRHVMPERFPPHIVALAALAAIVGQMFTVFLRGRGGKGVATSLGVAFGVSPGVALLCFSVYMFAYAATRLSSVGSLLGIWTSPVLCAAIGTIPRAYVVLSIVNALLVTARHRDNLRRLWRGQERRL
jgi:glycerol-3-phosphate acyltransferase PlsY